MHAFPCGFSLEHVQGTAHKSTLLSPKTRGRNLIASPRPLETLPLRLTHAHFDLLRRLVHFDQRKRCFGPVYVGTRCGSREGGNEMNE